MAVEKNDGGEIKDIVLTVPTAWNQRKRQALVDAASIAGFQGIQLVHETASAAVHLGMVSMLTSLLIKYLYLLRFLTMVMVMLK